MCKENENLKILNEVGTYAMMGLTKEEVDAQTSVDLEEASKCKCENCTCGKKASK